MTRNTSLNRTNQVYAHFPTHDVIEVHITKISYILSSQSISHSQHSQLLSRLQTRAHPVVYTQLHIAGLVCARKTVYISSSDSLAVSCLYSMHIVCDHFCFSVEITDAVDTDRKSRPVIQIILPLSNCLHHIYTCVCHLSCCRSHPETLCSALSVAWVVVPHFIWQRITGQDLSSCDRTNIKVPAKFKRNGEEAANQKIEATDRKAPERLIHAGTSREDEFMEPTRRFFIMFGFHNKIIICENVGNWFHRNVLIEQNKFSNWSDTERNLWNIFRLTSASSRCRHSDRRAPLNATEDWCCVREQRDNS